MESNFTMLPVTIPNLPSVNVKQNNFVYWIEIMYLLGKKNKDITILGKILSSTVFLFTFLNPIFHYYVVHTLDGAGQAKNVQT